MKIIVFGVGQVYKEKKAYIAKEDKIIAFFDNDANLWGTQLDGITIHSPNDISNFSYDKIVLMSVYALEMKKQLLELGCDSRKIVRYTEYFKNLQSKKDLDRIHIHSCCGDCLIITTSLDFNGGSMAAVYAALAIQKKGYEVTIAAPEGAEDFIEEIKRQGVNIIIYTNLEHACEEELFWTNNFQFIIVNTLQMICCAIAIANSRKVFLWLHEPKEVYKYMNYWDEEIREGIHLERLHIYAVSSIAKNNFLDKYFVQSIRLLPYGIPDERVEHDIRKARPLTFAEIGYIQHGKGQDIFLDAIEKLVFNRNIPLFSIIGKCPNDQYAQMIKDRVKQYSNVQLLGEMTHKEIMENNEHIDVFVISSREETMSIVATEAMMLGKVCIISDSSGMAKYIDEKINGLVFSTEKSEELSKKIMWCVENQDKLTEMGMKARETYETYFSMDVFGDNLVTMLNS